GTEVARSKDPVALPIDRLPLAIDDVVVLDDVLAGVEVVALDAGLRVLDRAAHHLRLEGGVLGEAEGAHDPLHAVVREPPHEVVLEAEVEAAAPRVALASGAAAELVVDAARLVAL